jgi:rubredoxin
MATREWIPKERAPFPDPRPGQENFTNLPYRCHCLHCGLGLTACSSKYEEEVECPECGATTCMESTAPSRFRLPPKHSNPPDGQTGTSALETLGFVD